MFSHCGFVNSVEGGEQAEASRGGGKAPTIVFSSFLLWGPAAPGEEGEGEVGRDFVGTPENIRRGRREGGGRELAPATGTA